MNQIEFLQVLADYCLLKSNMNKWMILLVLIGLMGCKEENGHIEPTHNFTVERLMVINDKDEILMIKDEEGTWYTFFAVFNKRQYVHEVLDSVSQAFGITTTPPELRGYFGFKYEYHPYATRRSYYVARYVSGSPRVAGIVKHIQWMPIDEALEQTQVEAMKEGQKQILDNPGILWGGSFEVYKKGKHHHTRMTEPFYPLLGKTQ